MSRLTTLYILITLVLKANKFLGCIASTSIEGAQLPSISVEIPGVSMASAASLFSPFYGKGSFSEASVQTLPLLGLSSLDQAYSSIQLLVDETLALDNILLLLIRDLYLKSLCLSTSLHFSSQYIDLFPFFIIDSKTFTKFPFLFSLS